MKTSLKVARSLQLVGALFFVAAIVSFSNHGTDFAWLSVVGLVLVIGPRIYEWLTRE